MPESIALKIKARVGGVFTMVNSRLGGIIPQGGLWRIQQRPDQFHAGIAGRGTSPLHPGQAFTTAASEQSQKKKFKLIIGMMRQGDRGHSHLQRRPRQEVVPPLSGGHFQGELLCARKAPNVRPLNRERQLQLLRRLPHQPFVGIAAPASQTVIQVGDRQLPAVACRKLVYYSQQHHRIQPARNCHQDWLALVEKAAAADSSFDVDYEVGHKLNGTEQDARGKAD